MGASRSAAVSGTGGSSAAGFGMTPAMGGSAARDSLIVCCFLLPTKRNVEH